MLAFDHAIILTPDVEATAGSLLERHGLATAPGGRHPGHGTANLIVPLGPDYLELMYVADEDEASGSPIGMWALEGAAQGPHVAALMLRVPDVTPFAERLDLSPTEVHRTRADGVELAWRLVGLDAAFSREPRPVFIECRMAAEHHPGREAAPHRTTPRGIAWAEFLGDPAGLSAWVGQQHDLDLRFLDGAPGPGRVAVATGDSVTVVDPALEFPSRPRRL